MNVQSMFPVSRADYDRARDTLASAYRGDPVQRWLYPEDVEYATKFPAHVTAFDVSVNVTSTCWQIDDFAAVAVWLPPGTYADPERIGTVLRGTVADAKHLEMFSVLEQLEEMHPQFPVWYLPWLGVRAEDQNRGLGSQLLAASLDLVDNAGMPAFLQTPSPRSVPFLERHGFAVTGHTESPNCPPLTLMLRAAR